jgi:hypothetical protein
MGNSRIQLRRGTTAFWESENPILFPGEPGVEIVSSTIRKLKIGDGKTHWQELNYVTDQPIPDDPEEPTDPTSLQEHIDDLTPHPVYDEGVSLDLIYQNAKV